MEEKDIDDAFCISVMHVVNTGKLWVSEPPGKDMSGQRRILQKLEENLSQLMCRTYEMPSNLPVNKLIAVKHEVTGCWHRGELLSPLPTSSSCRVRAFLVDHGAILLDVQPKHLQILPQEMHELPKQAFIVCLYGLIPISMTVHLEDTHDKMHYEECLHWTLASEALVRKCIKYATSAHLRGTLCKGHVVHGEVILNIPGKGFVSLNEELVKNNFAIYSEAKYEKVIEREAKLEERLIAKRLEANEKEERCFTPPPNIYKEIKPILMEDFLKEYANKKMLRKENNVQFLDSERYTREMRGCKVDDQKTREAIKNAMFASRVKTSGRGDNLSLMKEKNPVIAVGRGLPLLIEKEKLASSQMEDPQRKNSDLHNPYDIFSKSKVENLEESTTSQQDSSVLLLGRIPAGHPSQFEEISDKFKKTKGVTKKKEHNPYRSISSSYRKSPTSSPDHGKKANQLRDINIDISSNKGEFLDPAFLLQSQKTLSSKGPCENVSFLKRETGSNFNETSKEIVTRTKASVSPIAPCSKIMKLLLSSNRYSEEEKPDEITKDVGVSLPEKTSSTMHPVISNNKPYGNDLFSKESHDKSMRLKSQPLALNDVETEEMPSQISASFSDQHKVKRESTKKTITNPFQSLFEALRKKSKNDRDFSEEKTCSDAPFSGTVPPVLSHVNKQAESAKVDGCDTSSLSNVNQASAVSFPKRSSEFFKVQSAERKINITNTIYSNLDDSNDSKEDKEVRDETNTTDVIGDSCPKVSSDPDQLKAALDLISSFISNIETKDSERPPVDLIRLQRELNTFSQHVISKKTNKHDTSENVVSTPLVDNKSVRSSEHDLDVNSEIVVDTNSEGNSMDCIESFNLHPVMPLIEKPKFPCNNSESRGRKVEEMSSQEESKKILEFPKHMEVNYEMEKVSLSDKSEDTLKESKFPCKNSESRGRKVEEMSSQEESKKILEFPKQMMEVNYEMEKVSLSDKSEDTFKESLPSKDNESPENCSNIEQNIPNESSPFSLLSFFPGSKHSIKDDVKIISHEKPCSSVSKGEVSPDTSHGNFSNETASGRKSFLETFLSSKVEKRRLDIEEVKDVVQVSQKNICKDIIDLSEMNNESDTSVPLVKSTQESKPLDDDHVSRNISSCSKILQEMEETEKNKCLQIIKDEGIPMVKLSARLPASAAQNILKSKGSSPVSSNNKDCNSSSSAADEDSMISKQKTLEPEVISPVHKDNLPLLLRDSWLSGYSNDDCLFTHKRQKMCRVLVRGRFLAQRITSIAQATFPKSLHQALADMRFRDPMRIQTYAWPALMRGHDLVMVNPPRSGKTLGYLVPLLGFMLSPELYSELPAGNGPLVLIICPSWKVVSQVNEFCETLLSNIKDCVKVIPTYGGIEAEQTVSLINGCHVLISTPRCFLRLLKQDRITTSLEKLCHLVFDEADMLMKLFFPEVKEILRECRILLQRRARIAAESNPSEGAASYAMVKLVAASKSWCPQMESFVTNIIDKPVIFIGSYLEAAVYAQLKPKLHLVGFGVNKERREQEKIHLSENINVDADDIVLHIIKRRVGLYKIVVACESKTEALQLAPKITALGARVLVIHENVLHVDIAEAINTWTFSKQPGAYPVLIVTDEALPEVNIGDAEHLIHVGIPSSSKTQFGLRFSTLMDNYRDILDKASDGTKSDKNCFVDIIVDTNKPDLEMTGLIDFMHRLGMEIPKELEVAATKSLLNKERLKKKDIELCPNLKSFGECSSSSCNFRHVISPELDKPKDVPQSGEVCVKVLRVLDASHMSVRLLEHIDDNGCKTIYPNEYYVIASQMARYFGKSQNQVAHGNPKVGDLCAYETEINLFHRARVEKVYYSGSKVKIPEGVSINLIDMGINVKARVFQLFYLPDNMKEYPEQAKELIVANMLPRDLDSSWSKAACVKVAEWIEEGSRGESNGKIIIGKIVLALGHTIWVDPLECREWLINNKTNVIHLSLPLNLCQAGLAIKNPEHVKKIKQICEVAGMPLQFENSKEEEISEEDAPVAPINEMEIPETKVESDIKELMEWDSLDCDKIVEVHVVDVESPSCFTVQKVDAEEKLKDLMEEIQSWISDVWQKSPSSNVDSTKEYSPNSFCLGYFERDKCWNRAKVLSVLKTSSVITNYSVDSKETDVEKEKLIQYQLYFLDFGDSVTVSSSEVAPIPENFIRKVPFQAIECSLFGVKPSNNMSNNDGLSDSVEDWNEEAGDAFYALCRDGDDLDIYRILLAKVIRSAGEGAFGGPKYSVTLYDKGGSEGPVSLSKLLIEKGLATSCGTVLENEIDHEVAEEMEELASHWLGEGALLPYTHSLDLSTASEAATETPSVEDSSGALTASAKGSNPSLSESKLLSSTEVDDDVDDDSYDIVMSDDELKLYEERLRTFLGIPPRPDGIKKTEEHCLAIEGSTGMEETSSYGMLTPNEDHSSFTSFEDLGESFQQAKDGFEEIFDESPEDANKPERNAEGKSGNEIEVGTECHESVDAKESVEVYGLKCDSKLGKENEGNLEESCLSIETDCKKDEEFRVESSLGEPCSEKSNLDSAVEVSSVELSLDSLGKEVENSTLMSDNLSENRLGDTVNNNSGISGKVTDVVKCSYGSDSFVRPNVEVNTFLRIPAIDAKSDIEIDPSEIGRKDLSAQFMVPVKADSLNVDGKVNVDSNEAVCDNIAVVVKVDDEIPVSANTIPHISAETLVEDEPTSTEDSVDSLQGKHVLLSSNLSEVSRLEEDGTVITESTLECSVAIKDVTVQRGDGNNQAVRGNNEEKNLQLDEALKEGEGSFDFRKISDELQNPNLDSSFPVTSELTAKTENVSEVLEEGNDDSDKIEANTSLDVTDITDEASICSNEEGCVCVPCLIKAKTPSVKWAQTKMDIILTIDVPHMTRYQVHWMSNRKLTFFALSDADVERRFALEVELWGYVDSQNSQIAAVSDNSVKMILRKSFTCMEWPHLLLSGIKPLWLSVDFDAMEFDIEENFDEDPVPLVNYKESDEELVSDEDADSIDGQRTEEINYDPYDPLS